MESVQTFTAEQACQLSDSDLAYWIAEAKKRGDAGQQEVLETEYDRRWS